MKILVVSRLKPNNKISIITHRQMYSIQKLGHNLIYFSVDKGGLFGYLSALIKLRKILRKNNFDVVHAHYSLCGIISTLAGAEHLVVSLMGSDVKNSNINKFIIKYFIEKKWAKVIVKSEEMLSAIKAYSKVKKEIIVLPNGVDFELFKPLKKQNVRKQIGWDPNAKVILFGSDPARTEKRYDNAEKVVKNLRVQEYKIELKILKDVAPENVPLYINGADVVLLTSDREGSPNIIKEAMACNIPIVTTKVGDVEMVIGNTPSCIITEENNLELITSALWNILSSNIEKTEGRERIKWLSNELIAKKLVDFYEK